MPPSPIRNLGADVCPVRQFVFVSDQVAKATGSLTEWICKGGARLPVAAARPTAETEYVALSTLADGTTGRAEDEQDIKVTLPTPAAAPTTTLSRITDFVTKDLRYKFLLIILGLWALNQVYPAHNVGGGIVLAAH